MPELPEVETIRRQLAPVVEGRTIEAADVSDARWVLPLRPATFERRVTGRSIESLERRGKYFVFKLDDGSALLMHLRMTGNLLYLDGSDDEQRSHLRGQLWLEDGGSLAFVDPRRFGTAELVKSTDEYFATRLGPEPFGEDFNGELLHRLTRKRKTPVKAILLDQKTVAGVGNIYADEALYRAGIAPQKRAARLTRAQCDALAETVRDALNAGIDAKGASIDDFRDAYGVQGSFQDQFLVHLREGLECPSCGAPVIKTRVAGRGTYYCRNCQKP
ncbi:MAG: bifunctional DNA-formamidopyrimidine glycosylase/DNA-(apurinic or apyrimidinic site) lyase [Solirubrobacterales bacterium]